jgi:glycosyltransferase involved in cell wall biosynthesis
VLTQLSIVVPVRNDAKRLATCLKSIRSYAPSVKVYVIDNGSTDGSGAMAEELGALVMRCPDLRVGALRNRGCERSSSEFIAFVDSDHEVTSDWLEKGLEILLQDESIVATGSHYLAPLNGTWVQATWAIHRLRGPESCDVDWLGAGNLFVRRDAFEKVSGFREDLIAAEDVDLCHRLRQLGGRIVCDKRIRNIHHGEPKTLLSFLRKEYWRGSSGVKAWISQGFPLRDLPSLLWPLWHFVGGVVFASLAITAIASIDRTWATLAAISLFAWVLPSVVLAVRTCLSEKRTTSIPALAVLYFTYGIARAAALFK